MLANGLPTQFLFDRFKKAIIVYYNAITVYGMPLLYRRKWA